MIPVLLVTFVVAGLAWILLIIRPEPRRRPMSKRDVADFRRLTTLATRISARDELVPFLTTTERDQLTEILDHINDTKEIPE